jgi:hypothetical protein
VAPESPRLSTLLEYPELTQPLPAPQALPEDFETRFPQVGIAQIRRGPLSATLVMGGFSRFFHAASPNLLRRARVNTLRVAL